jgi:cation:H+ antiporter
MTVLLLLASFVLIVGGALLFTNAVEWAGHRLDLGQGAVGSLLAAVGTALPESMIPIVALISGVEGSTEVAVGAVIGAPFMLATVAMLLVATAALAYRERRDAGRRVDVEFRGVRRDLGFFLALFPLAILVGLGTSTTVQVVVGILLLVAYAVYSWRTVRHGGEAEGESELKPLTFDTSKEDPPNAFQLVAQLVVGLAMIVGGAELFVEEVTALAESAGISPIVLALVLAPLATELPEKANSFLWMRAGKDGLATGNITGAMTFQATVPVALLLFLIEWDLDKYAIVAGVVALVGGAIALWRLRVGAFDRVSAVALATLFLGFVVFAFAG